MPKFLWMPFVVLIIAGATIDMVGYPDAAWIVSTFGTVLVLLGLAIYAGIDSRQHWPGLTFSQRLGRIFSFQR
jgi:hypothetical protein